MVWWTLQEAKTTHPILRVTRTDDGDRLPPHLFADEPSMGHRRPLTKDESHTFRRAIMLIHCSDGFCDKSES